MKILTAAEIRRVDELSTERYGIPGIVLMENAGVRVVEAIEARVDDVERLSVVILCGKGNNGGDGFVVARQLIQRGVYPSILLFAPCADVAGDARLNLDILTALGYPPVVVEDLQSWDSECANLGEVDVVVDALLGTGLSKPVRGLLERVVTSIPDRFPRAMIVSVDVPSGCAADTGDLEGASVEADVTVTFSALKHCLVFGPACHLAGEVVVADIGNPHELVDKAAGAVELLAPAVFPEAVLPRDDDTNKGDFGKVLVVGGSLGKAGAAAMAACAALRAGAGLVTAAVPAGILATVAAHMPEVMTEALPENAKGSLSSDAVTVLEDRGLVKGKSVVALGPGLGNQEDTFAFVRDLVGTIPVPLVLDADGINAFAGRASELRRGASAADRPIVITPHPGEMARLIGDPISGIVRNRLGVARGFADLHGVYVVLKGFRTVIASPDGKAYVNPTGNAGMATAGSGDILTGIIAGLLGQPHLGAFDERLCLAVYLHGLAGDLAAQELGEETLVATDILSFLPEAWSALRD